MSRSKICVALALGASMLPAAAHAGLASADAIYTPFIVAGAPTDVDGPGTADSAAMRVDPNLPTSRYSGVVSLNIRYSGQSFICSGAMISPTIVLTAAHCIDRNGQGQRVDLTQPGTDVRAIFNNGPNPGDPGRDIITASQVIMHQDYAGFGNCPAGVAGFCVNDDLALVKLNAPVPVSAQFYGIHAPELAAGGANSFTMVGYGTSGDGVNGHVIGPNFRIKRSGTNNYDLNELDDEQNFAAGGPEVWYADFDGNRNGTEWDTFCTRFAAFGLPGPVCTGDLGNRSEANLGGGDSGGPSFIEIAGQLQLVGNNTFGGRFNDQISGQFGTYMGGMLLASYRDWIYNTAAAIPEPGMLGLGALGFAGFALARRRKQVA